MSKRGTPMSVASAKDDPRLDHLSEVTIELYEALEEMLTAHSMESIGVDASLRRTRAKAQARAALAKARGDPLP